MNLRVTTSFAALALLAAPLALRAQAPDPPRPTRQPAPSIPAGMTPPAGKCRIWMDDLPATQQPAPTDCQTALRQKPPNGTVIFGPAAERREPSRFSQPPQRRPDSTHGRATPRPDTTAPPGKSPAADTTRRATPATRPARTVSPVPAVRRPTKIPERP